MPPPDDRRERLSDAYRDLRDAAAAVPPLVTALGRLISEQDKALREAEAREQLARTDAERAAQEHAAALDKVTQAADESARAASETERDLDEARGRLAEHTARAEGALSAERSETARLHATIERLSAEIDHLKAERAAAPSAARPPRPKPTGAPDESERAPKPPADARPARKQTALKPSGTEAVPPQAEPDLLAEPTDAVSPGSTGGEPAVAAVFQAWCLAARPVVGRVEFFADHVRQAIPGASVSAVFRDANSQAQPVMFRAQGGASPVEYWLVSHAGQHALLPQPLAAQQFRELAPCMDGTATPAALREVEPAEVRPVGDQFELVRPGRVA
ncbi:MAG TPA: hypothetical protein VF594_03710 [Rubricoccaceae bacterium]|jgi:hypothetical protein